MISPRAGPTITQRFPIVRVHGGELRKTRENLDENSMSFTRPRSQWVYSLPKWEMDVLDVNTSEAFACND